MTNLVTSRPSPGFIPGPSIHEDPGTLAGIGIYFNLSSIFRNAISNTYANRLLLISQVGEYFLSIDWVTPNRFDVSKLNDDGSTKDGTRTFSISTPVAYS
jgi:hypothetical protein